MAGGPKHLGYGRDPADLERAVQQALNQSQNTSNLFNEVLQAFGMVVGPTGELIVLEEMGQIEQTVVHNQIVEFIENLLRQLLASGGIDITVIGGGGGTPAEQRPNVWEAYTGS
jgi:thiamine biosynthesis lipoprotein ApbE